MRMNLSGTAAALLRAVMAVVHSGQNATGAGAGDGWPVLVAEVSEPEPWASLTFTGARHCLDLRLEGPEAELGAVRCRLAERLGELDLQIAGHFLADAELRETDRTFLENGHISLNLRLLALTIEE